MGITLSRGKVFDEIHLCGGLRATQIGNDWYLGPLYSAGNIAKQCIGTREQLFSASAEIGQPLIGWDEVDISGAILKQNVWFTFEDEGGEGVDRLWSYAARNLRDSGETEIAAIAQNVSNGLRSAGLSLKDCSDCYAQQLLSYLVNPTAGTEFSNLELRRLLSHLSALAQDLCFVRDQIARVFVQIEATLPNSVDDWARLKQKKSSAGLTDPKLNELFKRMLLADDRSSSEPWLEELNSFRKAWTHKSYIAGTPESKPMLSILLVTYQSHPMLMLRLLLHSEVRNGKLDALQLFHYFWRRVASLARQTVLALDIPLEPAIITEADLI